MSAKKFAFYGGMIMVAMGLISLIFVGPTLGLPALRLDVSYGAFLGMFPMNILNKVALIIFGFAGMYVAKGYAGPEYSINYSRVVFFVMGALALLGLSERTNTLAGYWPLYGGEVILHGMFALLGGYVGYLVHRTHERHLHA